MIMRWYDHLFFIAMFFLAVPAFSQDSRSYHSTIRSEASSQVVIRKSDEPGAVAEVVFKNEDHVHNFASDTFTLTLDKGLQVEVTLTIDLSPGGPDKMSVVAPDGYFAVPYEIVVQEGAVGTIVIYTMETPSS